MDLRPRISRIFRSGRWDRGNKERASGNADIFLLKNSSCSRQSRSQGSQMRVLYSPYLWLTMDTQQIAQHILDIATKKKVDFCEVAVFKNEFLLKRLRRGQVDQPPAEESWGVDMAIVKGKRRKSITFDNPLLAERMIEKSLEYLKFLPEHEITLPRQVFEKAQCVANSFDEETALLEDSRLLEVVLQLNSALEAKGLILSGKITAGRGEIYYMNSIGSAQSCVYTLVGSGFFSFDLKDASISAYANTGGSSFESLDLERVSQELISKCELQRQLPKGDIFEKLREGNDLRMDVILEPYFLEPIFDWLGFFGFNGLMVERGESFISKKIGQELLGKNIDISDNPLDSRLQGIAVPFDFEGMPRSQVMLAQKGRIMNALYDSELARRLGKESTGNALPPSQRAEGAAPFNLVVEGGKSSLEEMIDSCQQPTLWITKLHYLGMKHFQTATMTGIAQHGVFLIEKGKVSQCMENVRFEEIIPEALKRVEMMGPSRLVFDPMSAGMPSGTVVPAMKIKDFRFVGSTKRTM